MLSAMLSTLAAKTKKVVAEPESPLDYETLLGVIVLSVCVMRPSLAGEALKFLAFGWAVVTAAARLGYTESDGLVVIATAFGLRAAEMLLKKGLTVLATFPLALTFKYVSPFLPRFSIPESKFFDCDGATPAGRRAAASSSRSRPTTCSSCLTTPSRRCARRGTARRRRNGSRRESAPTTRLN